VTLRQALTRARQMLLAAGHSDNPSLESEALLKYYLKTDRAYLHREPDLAICEETAKAFFQGIARLVQGEPLAYITCSREFFGLDFYVDPRVLVPRPETELIVEEALRLARNCPVNSVADIGAGSGAIAISLAKNLPQSTRIYATDISAGALEVAGINCLKHGVSERITLLQGDLLSPLPEAVDLLIANLPYVSRGDLAALPFARFEPAGALDGGESGLEIITRLCGALAGKIKPSGCILLEIGEGQGPAVTALLRSRFPSANISVLPDLAGLSRVVNLTQLLER
jgi:release factor glutamine methyltransferase